MTTREKLDYRDRIELDENLDYRDENTEGKEEHRTEHPNSSYQAANQHMVKFNDELKAINEQTAMDFEFRKNPAEYDLAERKEALEAVEQAFNKTQWNSNWERRIAAEDIAQNSFQPMYRRIEFAEAAVQHKLPDEFLEAAKQEQIEYAEEHQTEDGARVLEIGVKDIETAQRLVEHSKGAFQIVSTWQLDHYRDQFTDALYDSDKNPNATEQMGKFLEQGINHYNGEISREAHLEAHLDGKTEEGNIFQQDDEAASGKRQMAEEEYAEPSDAEMLTFKRLQGLDEETLDHEVSELLHQKLQHTERYLEELQKAGHRDADAAAEVQRTIHEAAYDGIQSSLEKNDDETFGKILRNIEECNREPDPTQQCGADETQPDPHLVGALLEGDPEFGATPNSADGNNDRRRKVTLTQDEGQNVRACVQALRESNHPPSLFSITERRGVCAWDGSSIQIITPLETHLEVTRRIRFVRPNKNGREQGATPTTTLMKLVHIPLRTELPVLNGVKRIPFLWNGTLIHEPGYHFPSGHLNQS